jgi:hypothetical protein
MAVAVRVAVAVGVAVAAAVAVAVAVAVKVATTTPLIYFRIRREAVKSAVRLRLPLSRRGVRGGGDGGVKKMRK